MTSLPKFRHVLLVVVCLVISLTTTKAQSNVKLKDIKEFQFIVRAGGFSVNYFRSLNVYNKNGKWNCMQIQQYNAYDAKSHAEINDTVKKFVKIIPRRTLARLVRLIGKKDSTVHPKKFKIDRDELVKDIDSMDFHGFKKSFFLTSGQHIQFERLLQSDSIINKEAYKVLHPRRMDDEDHYVIKLITQKDTLIVDAYSFVYPYYLPWHIKKMVSYNPEITLLFEEIRDNKNFAKNQRISFHRDIDRQIYFDYFRRHK